MGTSKIGRVRFSAADSALDISAPDISAPGLSGARTYIDVEIVGKGKKLIFFFKSEKILQVQLINFYYINVETIGKTKNVRKKINSKKKYTNLANEFLLHTIEAIGKLKKQSKNNFF